METKIEVTLDDLSHAPKDDGTYELMDGRLVHIPPTGLEHGYIGSEILFALKLYERKTGAGYAVPDNVGFIVNLPHRRSLSPDVAFTHVDPRGHREFVVGAPIFAVEIRSPSDYGRNPVAAMADKRADYFAAGTLVVWEVDLPTATIFCFRAAQPAAPSIFRMGDTADAEPALPGWRVPMRDIFR